MTRIVVIALGVALFAGQSGALALLRFDGSFGRVMMTPASSVSVLASAFSLRALRVASGVFARIDRGDAFGPAVVRGIENGSRDMRGASFDLDVENATLGLLGSALVLLARQGQNLKSKLGAFV